MSRKASGFLSAGLMAALVSWASSRAEAQNGLYGEYYDDQYFTNFVTGRVDAQVNFD